VVIIKVLIDFALKETKEKKKNVHLQL